MILNKDNRFMCNQRENLNYFLRLITEF